MFIDDLCPISDRENIRYLSIDHLNSLNRLCHLIKSCEIVINVHLSEAIIHLQREKILIKRYQIEIKLLNSRLNQPQILKFLHNRFLNPRKLTENKVNFHILSLNFFEKFCDFLNLCIASLEKKHQI